MPPMEQPARYILVGSTQTAARISSTNSVTHAPGLSFQIQSHSGETTKKCSATWFMPIDFVAFLLCPKKLLPPVPCKYKSIGQVRIFPDPLSCFCFSEKLRGKCMAYFRVWPVESTNKHRCSPRQRKQAPGQSVVSRSHKRDFAMSFVALTIFVVPSWSLTWYLQRLGGPTMSMVPTWPLSASVARPRSSTMAPMLSGARCSGRSRSRLPPICRGNSTTTLPSSKPTT
mmetsp:Transcript_101042/g.324531  ORF Transcript_101042/g.324531 Transcript_101042/m.324531 type:complete len:228 (+) Transcript_101042:549-1232(+)